MQTSELAPGLHILHGVVNCGALVCGGSAWLIDCDEAVTPTVLAALGVERVERILFTQHRRLNTAGAPAFVATGTELTVPRAERHLFDDAESHWNDFCQRWYVYSEQPGPLVVPRSLPVAADVADGDVLRWGRFRVRVVDTPGATDGSVSYLIDTGSYHIAFCGDLIYAPGQIHDLWSLQKGFNGLCDYHGFMGNARKLVRSLEKLVELRVAVWVPSRGVTIESPVEAAQLLIRRLDELERNVISASCVPFYFPDAYADRPPDDYPRMPAVPTFEPPPCVQRVWGTSFALLSDTGALLLMDCGHQMVVTTLDDWVRSGRITGVDACWVTHYHDDHTNALSTLVRRGIPIWVEEHQVDIIEHPLRYRLPCICPNPARVTRMLHDGECWDWHEFRLTACHFPGQTLYHAGLLAEGHGTSVFFAGDSGSPCGLDDHCPQNRNLLGAGRGFRRCIEIWREHMPDVILNEHQPQAFRYDRKALDYLDDKLAEREGLLRQLLPWEEPDFGLDPHWVRTYPYEQDALPGATVGIEVQFTNHAREPRLARLSGLVLPAGWRECGPGGTVATIPARADGQLRAYAAIPDDTVAGKYVLPVRIAWNGSSLGQFRHALVNVV